MVVAQRRIGIKGRYREREKMHLRDKFDPTSNDPKYAVRARSSSRAPPGSTGPRLPAESSSLLAPGERENENYKATKSNPLILISTL